MPRAAALLLLLVAPCLGYEVVPVFAVRLLNENPDFDLEVVDAQYQVDGLAFQTAAAGPVLAAGDAWSAPPASADRLRVELTAAATELDATAPMRVAVTAVRHEGGAYGANLTSHVREQYFDFRLRTFTETVDVPDAAGAAALPPPSAEGWPSPPFRVAYLRVDLLATHTSVAVELDPSATLTRARQGLRAAREGPAEGWGPPHDPEEPDLVVVRALLHGVTAEGVGDAQKARLKESLVSSTGGLVGYESIVDVVVADADAGFAGSGASVDFVVELRFELASALDALARASVEDGGFERVLLADPPLFPPYAAAAEVFVFDLGTLLEGASYSYSYDEGYGIATPCEVDDAFNPDGAGPDGSCADALVMFEQYELDLSLSVADFCPSLASPAAGSGLPPLRAYELASALGKRGCCGSSPDLCAWFDAGTGTSYGTKSSYGTGTGSSYGTKSSYGSSYGGDAQPLLSAPTAELDPSEVWVAEGGTASFTFTELFLTDADGSELLFVEIRAHNESIAECTFGGVLMDAHEDEWGWTYRTPQPIAGGGGGSSGTEIHVTLKPGHTGDLELDVVAISSASSSLWSASAETLMKAWVHVGDGDGGGGDGGER